MVAFGQYDHNVDGLISAADVGLFDVNGVLLTSGIVPAGTAGFLDGQYRYAAIDPIRLFAGSRYVIASYIPITDRELLTLNGYPFLVDPLISVIEARFSFDGGALRFPDTFAAVGEVYAGPNFQLREVPEPSTLLLIVLGWVGIAKFATKGVDDVRLADGNGERDT